MKTTTSQRVSLMLDELKLDQVAFGALAGASKSVVNQWISGLIKKVAPKYAYQIERNAGYAKEWVMFGTGDPRLLPSSNTQSQSQSAQSVVTARHPDDVLPDDMIEVMEYRVSFSAGNGHTPNYDLIEEREPATYRMSWFQRERINPAHVRRFKVTGDSMEPFLYSGDTVLVNLAENDATRIMDGKVYAIRYGDELRVKRLFRKLNGTLILRSENPAYKDEDVDPEVAEEHITIIGRVRDKGGSGGL